MVGRDCKHCFSKPSYLDDVGRPHGICVCVCVCTINYNLFETTIRVHLIWGIMVCLQVSLTGHGGGMLTNENLFTEGLIVRPKKPKIQSKPNQTKPTTQVIKLSLFVCLFSPYQDHFKGPQYCGESLTWQPLRSRKKHGECVHTLCLLFWWN